MAQVSGLNTNQPPKIASFAMEFEQNFRQIAREEAQKVFQESQESAAAQTAQLEAALYKKRFHSRDQLMRIIKSNSKELRWRLEPTFEIKHFAEALKQFAELLPGDMERTPKGIRWYSQVHNAVHAWKFDLEHLGPCPIVKMHRGVYSFVED